MVKNLWSNIFETLNVGSTLLAIMVAVGSLFASLWAFAVGRMQMESLWK